MQEAKDTLVSHFGQAYIGQALESCHGNITRAAAQSSKNRRAFFELMHKSIARAPSVAPNS